MDEAIAWHLGLGEAGSEEWRTFVAWLEADPAHQDAYDDLVMADADAAEALASVPAPIRRKPNIIQATPRVWIKRSGWGGGMLAAAAAAWLAILPLATPSSELYAVSTQPGMQHLLTLADGTKVRLNGDTQVTLDHKNPRYASVDRGEAMFEVVHHADHPFEVKVNGMTLRDVGTTFNVRRDAGMFVVAVAEGSVLFQPDREAVSLTPGMALAIQDGTGKVELRRIQATAIGSWSQGRLEYRNIPLADVAGDVARSTGAKVRVTDPMAHQPFTGTLRTDRSADEVVRSFAQLVDGQLRRDGPGWVISPKSAGAS